MLETLVLARMATPKKKRKNRGLSRPSWPRDQGMAGRCEPGVMGTLLFCRFAMIRESVDRCLDMSMSICCTGSAHVAMVGSGRYLQVGLGL